MYSKWKEDLKKEWTKKGKELRDERMGDALHLSSSEVSSRLPVTD